MRRLGFILIMSVCCTMAWAQNPSILITDTDMDASNPMDCGFYSSQGTATNFYDSGDQSANYSDNENDVFTVCPDLTQGSKVSVETGTTAGFEWSIDASDTLYVYDGPTTGSPLIGAYNSTTHPNGMSITASWNNPSGCLTFRFVSDGAVNSSGWKGNLSCGNPVQPFENHMEAYINGDVSGGNDMNPLDTGYVDVCLGDSILLIAKPFFPHDQLTTGTGYVQGGNYSVEWEFSDGTSKTGDTVWFKPPTRDGYLIQMKVTDQFPQSEFLIGKVRVSTLPSFATTNVFPDTICLGETSTLVGGITNSDTAGVETITGSFQLGGTFTGLTFLPDGDGASYQTSVNITGFGGGTIGSASDLVEVCLTMEHSYTGDLDIKLTCPSGVTVTLADLYNGNGGGTFLGDALDDGSINPGVGMEYCFDLNATFGNMNTELNNGNTIPSTVTPGNQILTPGSYQPEGNYNAFVGCPIDGNWTIVVTDNLTADNGYIFDWGITFDPAINPNNEFYTPSIVSEQWISDPTIISGDVDTAIVVRPSVHGDYNYTFQVTDNFGCVYDTSLIVHVRELPIIFTGDTACNNTYTVAGTTAGGGGTWSINGPGTGTFSPSVTALNPVVDVDQAGVYTLTFTDNYCTQSLSADVFYIPDVSVNLPDSIFFCDGEQELLDATFVGDPTVSYSWTNPVSSSPQLTVTTAGQYEVTLNGYCSVATDVATVTTDPCVVIVPNVFTPNGDRSNDFFVLQGIERWPNTQVIIYNRWGKKVYESDNYQNNWDGTNMNNGKKVVDGTYFYVVQYFNNTGESGTLNILSE